MSRTGTTLKAYKVDVQPQDKTFVRNFVLREIAYFNGLVASFSSRLRSMPELFNEMTGALEGLYGELAAQAVNVRGLKSGDLPDAFSKYHDALFEVAGGSKLTERQTMFLETAAQDRVLPVEVRRAMAVEMLRFYREQASAMTKTVVKRDDQVYRAPIELLEPWHDNRRKRHVQLPRTAVKVTVENHKSSIKIPYARTPLVINEDISAVDWNLLVLRDTDVPGMIGQWVVELRKEPVNYLLKLNDPPIRRKKPLPPVVLQNGKAPRPPITLTR